MAGWVLLRKRLRACVYAASTVLIAGFAGGAIPLGGTQDAASPDDLHARANATLGLASSTLQSFDLDTTPGQEVALTVVLEGLPVDLHLWPHSVRSDRYEVLVQVEGGELVPHEPAAERTLRGEVLDFEGSVVAASMLEDGLYARIIIPDLGEYWIEPIASRVAGALRQDHVVYSECDKLPDARTCALEDLKDPYAPDDQPDGDGGIAGTCPNLYVADFAADADFEYFSHWGSVSAVQNRINNVINTVNVQYERDVDITHVITTIIVRTTSNDPYTSSDPSSLLNQFRNYWLANHGGVTRDLAELFTGRNINGGVIGIAWLNAVCTSNGFSVVESDFTGNYSCVTDLSAHEMGHNWGANHCSCPSFTMNPSITCTNRFSTSSINSIISHRNSRTCLNCDNTTPTQMLDVDASLAGVPITVSPLDNGGQGAGGTPFSRIYDRDTVVTLTAPGTVGFSAFDRWTVNGSNQPVGQTAINVTLSSDVDAFAIYVTPEYTLTVDSTPDAGALVLVDPLDNNIEGTGATLFTRSYDNGTDVALTATSPFNGRTFSHWTIDGSNQPAGQTVVVVSMTADASATVHYGSGQATDAPLNGMNVTTGTLVSGGLAELNTSDDTYVVLDPALVATNKHVAEVTITALSPFTSISRLDLRVETGTNRTKVVTKIFLNDRDLNTFTQIDKFLQPRPDTVSSYADIANADAYVRDSDGLIRMRLFSRRGAVNPYEYRIDEVEFTVTP